MHDTVAVSASYWGGVEVALTFSNFTKFHHCHHHTTVGIEHASPVRNINISVVECRLIKTLSL